MWGFVTRVWEDVPAWAKPLMSIIVVLTIAIGGTFGGAQLLDRADDGEDGNDDAADVTTTTTPPTTTTTTPATAELTTGEYYFQMSTSDRPLTQIVDTTRIPTLTFDPAAAWVNEQGYPVPNPSPEAPPLTQAAADVARAFGTPEAVAGYLRRTLKPLDPPGESR